VVQLRTHLYRPQALANGRPLLIALHGCTQSPDALRDRGNFESAAEAHGAVIALPAVPNGGVLAGCWDYYGANHTLESRHDDDLVALADALAADSELGIDADRIYLAGLSSGGGEAAIMACLAPDRFAGIGINAGPAIGTESFEIGSVATDQASAVALCRALAGPRAAGFETQLTSVIAGSADFLVARGYARLNAEIMAEVYGAETESALDVSALAGTAPRGEGALWSDARGPRVSLIVVEGMGHAFPAGAGDGLETNFVAQKGVAWPEYLLAFFAANNRRVAAAGDAGVGTNEDGAVVADGGLDRADSGDPDDPTPSDAGCACSASEPSAPWSLLILLLVRRRR
jgi:poly(3-hydroxybutyrate) depolymerase